MSDLEQLIEKISLVKDMETCLDTLFKLKYVFQSVEDFLTDEEMATLTQASEWVKTVRRSLLDRKAQETYNISVLKRRVGV